MLTLSYVYGVEREIKVGDIYYFGQLWNGEGEGEEILKSGSVGIDESIVEFEVIEEHAYILNSVVKVTDLY